jgi:hypothetical protein
MISCSNKAIAPRGLVIPVSGGAVGPCTDGGGVCVGSGATVTVGKTVGIGVGVRDSNSDRALGTEHAASVTTSSNSASQPVVLRRIFFPPDCT